MRIWDCHPAELCNKHLLAQHLELHCIASVIDNGGGYSHHPEVRRFAECDRGRYWLVLVHSMMVEEMELRWPGRHGYNHPSSMPSTWPQASMRVDVPMYIAVMRLSGYPLTRLEHGTPWERDGVDREWYLEHRDDWSSALVQDLHVQAAEMMAEPASVDREAEVVIRDGKPHLAASSYRSGMEQ